ncbi:hypothetical protein MTBBW1_20007 [Desulfamplus magnetovallimortis]|uniref:Uncharacterized protein n=1 Tax=Desulfamplus magnetovallimortis TaxID=1246637 RepID=A0A1W1HBF3_9BACT|nr:hypothetical protein MTBBW1_20007 [Desulfamplus magnetovallimortis]
MVSLKIVIFFHGYGHFSSSRKRSWPAFSHPRIWKFVSISTVNKRTWVLSYQVIISNYSSSVITPLDGDHKVASLYSLQAGKNRLDSGAKILYL